jgi:hypothetical protein
MDMRFGTCNVRNLYRKFVGNNIRMNLGEGGLEILDWMHLTQASRDQRLAPVNTVLNLRAP